MRATVYDGRCSKRVELSPWVKLHAPSVGGEMRVVCERCERAGRDHMRLLGSLSKYEAEKELGSFAVWHGRCGEPPMVRMPVVGVKAHQRRAPTAFVVYRKRPG